MAHPDSALYEQTVLGDPDVDKPIETGCGVGAGIILQGSVKASEVVRAENEALQARGREIAGIAVQGVDGKFRTYSAPGLVAQVLAPSLLDQLGENSIAIGHNRFSTTGNGEGNDQPITLSTEAPHVNDENIVVSSGEHMLSVGHNGNLFETSWYEESGALPLSEGASDSYHAAHLFMELRKQHDSWKDTFIDGLNKIEKSGSGSFVMMTEDGSLWGTRLPNENRLLSLGKYDTGSVLGYVFASEEIAINAVGAEYMRDVIGGELIQINSDGEIHSYFYGTPRQKALCSFESIYFARPGSLIEEKRVSKNRESSGVMLGRRIRDKQIPVSKVVPVLQSGFYAGVGVAQELVKPFSTSIETDLFKGRTFILPGDKARTKAVNGKHTAIPDDLVGEDVLFIDDSIVHFTTSKHLTAIIRSAGAKSVHVGVACPPIKVKCDLGVNMKEKPLPAAEWSDDLDELERQAAEYIGADSVTFLPVDDMLSSMDASRDTNCTFCFEDDHPLRDYVDNLPRKERSILGKPKIMTLASGGGTNFQEIITGVEDGYIDAELVGLISNNPAAHALERAYSHDILSEAISSAGKLKDPAKRREYLEQVAQKIECSGADLVVLAGWMVVLDDVFLQKMQDLEIPVLNLHPALLSADNAENVMTSRGKIPVVRGAHAIYDAYAHDPLRMQVSGVTVHQVLPGNQFDVGPIVMKEEVRRHADESIEEWEQRIHTAEYRVLPAAINYALHVMNSGIDASKGRYPW
ncbi:hypothetical protein HY469_03735 [Candidatus Roizmanbacteria bacterium]|nr:hypothetical protein [Candidatus Roizmanbacteria bacterium]